MSLASLIRGKSASDTFATATPATFATQEGKRGRTVASVATVAVAKSPQGPTAPPAKVSPGDTATASGWWLIHYTNREPAEVACYPDATHAEMLERYVDAVAAEPFTPTILQPSAPLTASEETAIRAWLALIEETDPATIAEVIDQCQRVADAREYFIGRSREGLHHCRARSGSFWIFDVRPLVACPHVQPFRIRPRSAKTQASFPTG